MKRCSSKNRFRTGNVNSKVSFSSPAQTSTPVIIRKAPTPPIQPISTTLGKNSIRTPRRRYPSKKKAKPVGTPTSVLDRKANVEAYLPVKIAVRAYATIVVATTAWLFSTPPSLSDILKAITCRKGTTSIIIEPLGATACQHKVCLLFVARLIPTYFPLLNILRDE